MFDKKPLIIFEMANNHMGDEDFGLDIINSFGKFVEQYPDFKFAFKFQFRDIPTFIHPDYQNKKEIKYVKRFSETWLTNEQFSILFDKVKSFGMEVIVTPFDEISTQNAVDLKVDIIKIASCSCGDWPLIEKIIKVKKPIIFSTAGSQFSTIDNMVSFLQHREKNFAIMHCVGEYPTQDENLQLNQITELKTRYPGIPIGFSTHENPENYNSIFIAIGKGAMIFEKHVSLETVKYKKNKYSATPKEIRSWLNNGLLAYKMLGENGKRYPISKKEYSDLRQFKRGVFAKEDIAKNSILNISNSFYAWPPNDEQLLANDLSKYKIIKTNKTIKKNDPVYFEDVEINDTKKIFIDIIESVKVIINRANLIYPGGTELEISHHYGIQNFHQTGTTIIPVINREYCKKLIIMLPKQKHPEQFHKKKEETFHILYGDLDLYLDDKLYKLHVGSTITIKKGVRHKFHTSKGCVFEEISSTHYLDDSYYTDNVINQNSNRKTLFKHWL